MPVGFRIDFEISLITFKPQKGPALGFIADLLARPSSQILGHGPQLPHRTRCVLEGSAQQN